MPPTDVDPEDATLNNWYNLGGLVTSFATIGVMFLFVVGLEALSRPVNPVIATGMCTMLYWALCLEVGEQFVKKRTTKVILSRLGSKSRLFRAGALVAASGLSFAVAAHLVMPLLLSDERVSVLELGTVIAIPLAILIVGPPVIAGVTIILLSKYGT